MWSSGNYLITHKMLLGHELQGVEIRLMAVVSMGCRRAHLGMDSMAAIVFLNSRNPEIPLETYLLFEEEV